MAETEVDQYKLDTKQGKDQSLRVSLLNNRVYMHIVNLNNPAETHSNLIRLEQFKNACEAFDNIKTIKEALNIIKSTIENGRILISEDEEAGNIDIKFNIRLGKKNYPPFVIGLPLDEESEVEEEEEEIINQSEDDKKQNNVEVLPTKFDYQGDKAAEAKYGQTTENTTEYANPIIKNDIKETNLVLEYIEPILQVHYPDGTTKSTPLPPRLQTEDGKKPNINPEQLKSLREQMTRTFNQNSMEFERSNSATHRNLSNYSRQTVGTFGNNNILKQKNNITINNEKKNNDKRTNINKSVNINNNINAVRSAMDNTKNLVNFNNKLKTNIKLAKTSITQNDNNKERGTDINIKNKNNKGPSDNYMNHRQKNKSKEPSGYSVSSVPNKPLVVPDYYGNTPNPTINNNSNKYEQNTVIQEVPNFINQSQNINLNLLSKMYQRNLSKSSSSPNMASLEKENYNYYQQNTGQINFPTNVNQSYIQNQINNINLNVRYPNQPLSNQNLQNSQNNLSQTQNPHLSQNNRYNIQLPNTTLIRHNSSQTPLLSQSYVSQMSQQDKNKLLQQRMKEQQIIPLEQRKIDKQNLQEQKKNQSKKSSQKKKTNGTKSTQISQQILKKNANKNTKTNNRYEESDQLDGQEQNQQNPQSQSQTQKDKNQVSQSVNEVKKKRTEPIEISRKQKEEMQQSLKQSQSQQIIRQKPLKDEITEQQIKLAQMASLQNLKNPKNMTASAVSLNKRFLDPQGNEETQSQFEEEVEAQKKQMLQQNKDGIVEEEEQEQEQNEVNEAEVFENLYRTEEGLIIFRNGLLRGIIHKFAEITDVVSKIQIMFSAGVKFLLLYRASEHGDKAKTFHEKCDNHQYTLVLVETTKGARFGGFTTKTWDGKCVKKIDNNAFVFSIDKNKIYDVRKNDFAIGGYPKFGPVFFGCQIRIYDDFFKKGGTTCYRGLNYKTRNDFELNNGEQTYIVKEIEVYDVEVIKMI